MSVFVDFKGTHSGTARGMDAASSDRTLLTVNTPAGRRRVTAGNLIKGLAVFSKQHRAAQARAFDTGLKAAANRIANNALADALRTSNQRSQQSNARAIDAMFDAPAPVVKNLPLLDALDGIVPQRAQELDDAIDGIIPAAPQSLSKVIEEL